MPANMIYRASKIGAGLFFGLALAACSAVQPAAENAGSVPVRSAAASPSAEMSPSLAPTPSSPDGGEATVPARVSEAEIKAAIQETLDLYAAAYNENNRQLLTEVVDQTSLPLRRFIQTRFDTYQESILGGGSGFGFSVESIRQRENGFVEAQVRNEQGLVADWPFREVGGRWLMSEPTEQQIGKKQEIATEHFVFHTYPWADELTPTLIELMQNARERVEQKLGRLPEDKADVVIKPVFGVGPPQSPGVLAYYKRAGSHRSRDQIVIFAPRSYSFQFYDPALGWERELEDTLTHEYAHLVNNRSFTPIHRMNDWMVEGLAEYVAGTPRPAEVSAAARSGKIIPIRDTTDRVAKQDLEHLTILENDISLAYGLSYELVDYIAEAYGGLDGFWKIVQAYDKVQNFDRALQQSVGIGYEQFDRDWREWLEAKY